MIRKSRKGVLILCYNANERNFFNTVWGIPPDRPGRVVRGVALLLEESAIGIICTSAFGKEGKSSGELMKEILYERIEELQKFTIYPILSSLSPGEIKKILDEKLRIVNEPVKNTSEEILIAGKYFQQEGVQKVYLVTSPDHISRTLRDAIVAWKERYPELAANVVGAPCVTLYTENDGKTPPERASVNNVVIAEPRSPLVPIFQQMFRVAANPEALVEIDREIDRIIKKYEATS